MKDESKEDGIEYEPSQSSSDRGRDGTILVTVLAAKDLVEGDAFSASDPYVVITCGEQMGKSRAVRNDLYPVWNYEMAVSIEGVEGKEITVEIFDKDTDGKDPSLGFVTLAIDDVIKERVSPPDYLELRGVRYGQVLISTEYKPSTRREPSSTKMERTKSDDRQSTARDSNDKTVDKIEWNKGWSGSQRKYLDKHDDDVTDISKDHYSMMVSKQIQIFVSRGNSPMHDEDNDDRNTMAEKYDSEEDNITWGRSQSRRSSKYSGQEPGSGRDYKERERKWRH